MRHSLYFGTAARCTGSCQCAAGWRGYCDPRGASCWRSTLPNGETTQPVAGYVASVRHSKSVDDVEAVVSSVDLACRAQADGVRCDKWPWPPLVFLVGHVWAAAGFDVGQHTAALAWCS